MSFYFSREEKGSCKLLLTCMQVHHNEKMKELVYPYPILFIARKFVTLRQRDSSLEEKIENY